MLREFFFVLIFHFNIFACFQANLRASIVARMHPCAPSSWPRSRWEILITTSKTNTRSDIWVSLFGWPSFISLLGLILFCSKLQCRLSGDWRGHGSGCERQEQEIQLHKMINEQLPHLIKKDYIVWSLFDPCLAYLINTINTTYLLGRSTIPKRMNFRKSSKRPLTPPPFLENHIADFFRNSWPKYINNLAEPIITLLNRL